VEEFDPEQRNNRHLSGVNFVGGQEYAAMRDICRSLNVEFDVNSAWCVPEREEITSANEKLKQDREGRDLPPASPGSACRKVGPIFIRRIAKTQISHAQSNLKSFVSLLIQTISITIPFFLPTYETSLFVLSLAWGAP
jgi:hypothetical protein